MKYTILDLNQRLVAKVPVLSRLMVKFNGTKGSPRIKTIRLNGRQICPPEDREYYLISNIPPYSQISDSI